MKPAQIFHQYIWIINKLRACGGLTFEQLNKKWVSAAFFYAPQAFRMG